MSSNIPSDSYVIIIGAMKSGTTFLFELLSQHPQICPSCGKEPEFFSHYQGLEADRYEDIFDFDPSVHTRCLEASTGYTKFPYAKGVPKRMKEYGIEPRFIYSVRNPFDRVESDYNFAHLGHKPWAKDEILNSMAVNISKYYMQIREFTKIYPDKDRYFIVDFDDISNRPDELANDIFEWAGVRKMNLTPPGPKGETPSPSRIEERIKRVLIGSSIPWRRIIPSKLITTTQKLFRKYDSPAKRSLNKDEEAKLHSLLREDMKQFGKSFDFPVEKWGFERES